MAGTMSQTAFVGSRVAIKTRTAAPSRNVTVRVAAKFAGNWLPGSTQPAYLESLPGAYGFVRSVRTDHLYHNFLVLLYKLNSKEQFMLPIFLFIVRRLGLCSLRRSSGTK